VILVERGEISAVGDVQTISLPPSALLIDAEQGVMSAGDVAAVGKPVVSGQPADLVCHTRFGEIAWAMKAGVVVYPANAAPPPAPMTWEAYRAQAIDLVFDFLQRRPETQHVQRTDAIPGYQKRGIDIVWRFRDAGQEAQSLSIRVTPSLDDHPARIFVLDGPSARKLPTAGLSATRAHWWFYYHGPDNALYCLPVTALKRWMDSHAKEIPPTRVQVAGVSSRLSGRAIEVDRLQRDIERMRVVQL